MEMNPSNISGMVTDTVGHVSTNSSHVVVSSRYTLEEQTVYTVVISINNILGLPTNVYVVWLIMRGAGGTMATEFFSLNLAVSEFLLCLFCMFFYAWLLKPLPIFQSLLFFSSGFRNIGVPIFQTCICLERYLAVVHPVVFLRYKPLRYKLGCAALVWMIVLVMCLFLAFKNMGYDFYMGLYGVTLCLVLYCCLSVLKSLKRPRPGEREGGREGEREREREKEGARDMKMRAFKIILITMGALMLNYTPVLLMFSFSMTSSLFGPLGLLFMVLGGLVQPFLYLHRYGRLPCMRGF